MWYGNHVGKANIDGAGPPTYIYPVDLVTAIRRRFNDSDAGKRDSEFVDSTGPLVYRVTWDDIIKTKWPQVPKACKSCIKSRSKPY